MDDERKDKTMWQELIQIISTTVVNNKSLVMAAAAVGVLFGAIMNSIAPHLWYIPWILIIFELHILICLLRQD